MIYGIYDIDQLTEMLVPELLDIAAELLIPNAKKLDKQELIVEILEKQAELQKNEVLKILIDPGTAPPEEVASLLVEISKIYRMMGGAGITFKLDHVSINQEEAV